MACPELCSLLYHGSTLPISRIDLNIGAPGKDFGQGFYTTTSQNQAEKFARLKARRIHAPKGYVSVFEYVQKHDLQIKRFDSADVEWLAFILENRGIGLSSTSLTTHDIIIGPVANDAVGLVLNQLLVGTYGDQSSPEARNTAIRLLASEKLYNQVFFGTEAGIAGLQFREAVEIGIN